MLHSPASFFLLSEALPVGRPSQVLEFLKLMNTKHMFSVSNFLRKVEVFNVGGLLDSCIAGSPPNNSMADSWITV